VGSVGLRKPKLQLYDIKRILVRLRKIMVHQSQHENPVPVTEVHPFIVPFYDMPGVRRLNDHMLLQTLIGKMKALNFEDVIVLPSTPLVAGLIGNLGESSSHYFCVDDYSQFTDAFALVSSMEQEMLAKVDSVFSISERLVQSRMPATGRGYFFPQGVEVDHFIRSRTPVPSAISRLRRPIIGFFGMIAPWIDLQLVEQCAKHYPEASFVLIGRTSVDLTVLSVVHNIFFIGEVPYGQLPAYAQAFDVALIPFVVNDLTRAANPLKLLEYLALELPVVSTDLPAIRNFKDHVHIAESAERFVELVGVALKDKDPERVKARRTIAGEYSWSAITERVSDIIERIDTTKHPEIPGERRVSAQESDTR